MRAVNVRLIQLYFLNYSFHCLLYAYDLVLCGESEVDLKVMLVCFVEVWRRIGLKVNADNSKVIVLGGGGGIGA